MKSQSKSTQDNDPDMAKAIEMFIKCGLGTARDAKKALAKFEEISGDCSIGKNRKSVDKSQGN